jgi:hypothetical protein
VDRQAQRTLPLGDEFREQQHRPAVAAWTVRAKFVIVFAQAGDAAEVDHAASIDPMQDHCVSRSDSN